MPCALALDIWKMCRPTRPTVTGRDAFESRIACAVWNFFEAISPGVSTFQAAFNSIALSLPYPVGPPGNAIVLVVAKVSWVCASNRPLRWM